MEAHRKVRFFVVMSRKTRHQMPGGAFHITARTQGKAHWFTPYVRDAIYEIIAEGVGTSDSTLLAQTVMVNHFHIVLRQGTWPLGRVMQPIMRRTSLLVQRHVKTYGHVFGQKFFSVQCANADHLRRAVVYTHVNPVRARLCQLPEEYVWSSHAALNLRAGRGSATIADLSILRLFADEPGQPLDSLVGSYRQFVEWRLKKDLYEVAEIPFGEREPETRAGDTHFRTCFCEIPMPPARTTKDLRDRAIEILFDIDPASKIDDLRRRTLPRPMARLRARVIGELLKKDHKNKRIAEYFRVSDTTVSAVATQLRYG